MATFPTPESRYTPPVDARGIMRAEELLEIAERAQSFTNATGVMIALRGSNELIVRTSNGIAPEVGACIPLPSGVTGLCVTTKKPQTCASPDAEAQLEAVFRAISVRSVLAVPIQWDGEVRGVLTVLSQMPGAFSRTHVAILMTLQDVIANKLRQCELPCDSQPQAALVAEQVVGIDLESLLKVPAPKPIAVAPKPAAPAPRKASALPAQLAAPAAALPAETALATPAASSEQKLPVATSSPSQPAANPLAELFKKPAEAPVEMSPDVLCPGEDPRKYGSVEKPKPVVRPAIRATATAAGSSPTMFAAYRAPARSNRKNIPLFVGFAAAAVVLGLASTLYPWHKPGDATPPATASVATQEIQSPSPAPAVIAVPLPKSAGEQPPAAAPSKPAASTTTPAKREEPKRAEEEPKRAAEETVQESVPILRLASGKPVAKSVEPIEAPALGLMAASSNTLPDLPAVPAPAASLALRKSALVPATLVQGRTPQYPEAARRIGLSGMVKLHISISAEGKVTEVRALTGDPFFRQASITAVRDWVYRPAYLDGKPVPSTAEVSLRFNPPR